MYIIRNCDFIARKTLDISIIYTPLSAIKGKPENKRNNADGDNQTSDPNRKADKDCKKRFQNRPDIFENGNSIFPNGRENKPNAGNKRTNIL